MKNIKITIYTIIILCLFASLSLARKHNLNGKEIFTIDASEVLYKRNEKLKNFINQNPSILKNQSIKQTAWTFTVGSTYSWYADSLIGNEGRYLVPSTCRAVGNNCYVFVENTSWNSGRVNQIAVDSVRLYFDSKTPANPTKGIYETVTTNFGNPPNVDGDNKIIILLLDIIDGYSGSGGYVAGYFYGYNEMPASTYPTSNEAEIFFIDTNPLDLKQSWGIETGVSTLAHEFQHMIHFNYDRNEITFINEGCSLVAEVICGFEMREQTRYSQEPNQYLFMWRDGFNDVLTDYSRAARFAVYLRDQEGADVFKYIVADTVNGGAGISSGLNTAGKSLRFIPLVTNWLVANMVDNRSYDTRYGYIYPNLPKPVTISHSTTNVSTRTEYVERLAAQYIRYSSGSQLYAKFNVSDTNLIIKAYKKGVSTIEVVNVTSGEEIAIPEFGSTYNEVYFIAINRDPYNIHSFTYSSSSSPEKITHTKYNDTIIVANGTANIANVYAYTTDSSVIHLKLQYRKTGMPYTYPHLEYMNRFTNDNVTIPADAFIEMGKAIGVDYRIYATDVSDNVLASTIWYSIPVRNGPGMAVQHSNPAAAASTYPAAEMQKAYRIFSIPYNLDNKTMGFIPHNLGQPQKDKYPYYFWRLQRLKNGGKQDFHEFATEPACYPGSAFFLIIREQNKFITLNPEFFPHTMTNAADMFYNGIMVNNHINNWYLIGMPINNVMLHTDSLIFEGATPLQFAKYTGNGPAGGWEVYNLFPGTSLIPWEGVAVKTSGDFRLKFASGQSGGTLPKKGVNAQMLRNALPKVNSSPLDWQIKINAYRKDINLKCENGGIGMHTQASEDHDQFDIYQPPLMDNTISIGFDGTYGPRIKDMRPYNSNGKVWNMKITTNAENVPVVLNMEYPEELSNQGMEAFLIDLDSKSAYNLKQTKTLEINSGSGVRNFNVVVGKSEFIESNKNGVSLIPEKIQLHSNFPNPFNPTTYIKYTLPQTSALYNVKLRVFNILGQEIATLVNTQQTPGYYTVPFSMSAGINSNVNKTISSGIYFYQLIVNDGKNTFIDTKKMILLK